MKKKININLIDANSFPNPYSNPKKSWFDLMESVKHINNNFKKNQISPEEISEILEIDTSTNTIPDQVSIENIRSAFHRIKNEYRISQNSNMFLEFDRLTAVYLFSIGAPEKAIELLNSIINSINESIETTKNNLDISLLCLKDCVKLNIASIYFWQHNFDDAKALIEEVLTFYEAFDNELYLIKMTNFISVSLTYLAWYYVKKEEYDDAEKSFFHALKVLSTVKQFTKSSGDPSFIYTKHKKIFIYDQLINFYSFLGKYELVKQPIEQILIIMEKRSFKYNIDITPINHVYFYLSASLLELKSQENINIGTVLVYFSSILKIYFQFSEQFEPLNNSFFKILFKIIDLYRLNKNSSIIENNLNKNLRKTIDEVADSLDEILGRFDLDGTLSFNLNHSNSIIDLVVSLAKYQNNLKTKDYIFNYIQHIMQKYSKTDTQNKVNILNKTISVNENELIEIASEQMLSKYALIISDLINSKFMLEGICLKSLNGFLHIEDDEINLYIINRFSARISNHQLYQNTIEDSDEDSNKVEDDPILNIIIPKFIQTKFAPLYYKRIKYRVSKGTRTFHLPIYFGIVNLLYSMNLYPCVIEMLNILINNFTNIITVCYNNKDTLKHEGLIQLFEFIILFQVDILIKMKSYDQALFYLFKIISPINEVNFIYHRLYLSLCLHYCYYYDLSNFFVCEMFNEVKRVISSDKNKFNIVRKKESEENDKETKEEGRFISINILCNILFIIFMTHFSLH